MDERKSEPGQLKSWIELGAKYGTVIATVVGVVVTMYTRFVSMEHKLDQLTYANEQLTRTLDRLNGTVVSLHEELTTEKSNTALLSLRLSILEKETTSPRLYK